MQRIVITSYFYGEVMARINALWMAVFFGVLMVAHKSHDQKAR
jgi:hypothetical protein